jgi:multicomponent Na+:H+ antiporter subunit D
MLDDAARARGYAWIPPLIMIATGVSAGAILRAAARVFVGWGPKADPLLTPEPPEEPPEEEANLGNMITITTLLIVIGLALSVVPGLEDRAEHAGDRFRDRHAYVERTLFGNAQTYGASEPVVLHAAKPTSVLYGIGAGLIALATAGFGLFRRRLPEYACEFGARFLEPVAGGLKAVHTGVPGDYVMWITVGTALLGGVWTLTLR